MTSPQNIIDAAAIVAAPEEPSSGDPLDLPANSCLLTDAFAVEIQLVLATIAVLSLLYKRHREHPQRPLRIWMCDVSKQAAGAAFVHILNLLFSVLPAFKYQPENGACVQYFLNVALDTTIGVFILSQWLRLFRYTIAATLGVGTPSHQDFISGRYGTPPRIIPWLKQTLIFSACLFCMKLCVVFLIRVLPFLTTIGGQLLLLFGSARSQALFVILIFPLCMNVMQFWIVDHMIRNHEEAIDYNQSDELGNNQGAHENNSIQDNQAYYKPATQEQPGPPNLNRYLALETEQSGSREEYIRSLDAELRTKSTLAASTQEVIQGGKISKLLGNTPDKIAEKGVRNRSPRSPP